jgi:hypothetical protein
MNKITYYGSEKEIAEAVSALKKYDRRHKKGKLMNIKEAKARVIIQDLIDEHDLTAGILINGNNVWSKTRILANMEQIKKTGLLYSINHNEHPVLSQYFYQFLILCGSTAHSDINGWIHIYPTIERLKQFFKHNEFGKRVNESIPAQWTDVQLIVEAIEAQFFPLESYVKSQEKK